MRAWTHDAIARIDADFTRSADTHRLRVDLPALRGVDLYLKDESTHPTGSLKHRLARSALRRVHGHEPLGQRGSIVTLLCDPGDRCGHTYFDDGWVKAQGIEPAPYARALDHFAETGIREAVTDTR